MYQIVNGLVLKANISAEADKAVVLYTRELGKVSAVAPGAKKIKAKLGTATEPLVESEFMLYVTSSYSRAKITGARILSHFPKLSIEWRRHVMAQYCAEVCEVMTPYHSQNPARYDLLFRTWQLLETANKPSRIVSAYVLRFLKLSGYSFLDYMDREPYRIQPDEKEAIKKLSTLSGEDLDIKVDMAPEMEENVLRRVESYLNQYLPRMLYTQKFIDQTDI